MHPELSSGPKFSESPANFLNSFRKSGKFFEQRAVVVASHSAVVPSLSGATTTLAGTGQYGFRDGDCSQAQFYAPLALSIGPDDIIYVADTDNHLIRLINKKTNTVSTVAGT